MTIEKNDNFRFNNLQFKTNLPSGPQTGHSWIAGHRNVLLLLIHDEQFSVKKVTQIVCLSTSYNSLRGLT